MYRLYLPAKRRGCVQLRFAHLIMRGPLVPLARHVKRNVQYVPELAEAQLRRDDWSHVGHPTTPARLP